MTSVGVRELRQNASALLRLVASGETIEVTDRGRPVARIVPLNPGDALERLVDEGRAVPPDGDLLGLEPLKPQPGATSLSEHLMELRSDER